MKVYRLTAEKFKDDLSGKGAAIYGGRWNPVSLVMLYTSESRGTSKFRNVGSYYSWCGSFKILYFGDRDTRDGATLQYNRKTTS